MILIPVEGPGNFYRWEGDYTGSSYPAAIIMNENKTITARFATSNLVVSGDITLNDVEPGGNISTTIILGNGGEQGSQLHWVAEIHTNWGIWVMNTTSNNPLGPNQNEKLNITITNVPNKKLETFEGYITFTNTLDPADTHNVLISLTTSFNRNPVLDWLTNLFKEVISQFPFIQQLIETFNSYFR